MCFLDGKSMRDQWTKLKLAASYKFQERFHVARFRPPHVADGIVIALLLVGSVVPAWAIRPGDAKIKFLVVVELAFNFHSHCAHSNDNATIARNLGSKIDGRTAGGLRGNQNCINSPMMRVSSTQIAELGGDRTAGIRTQLCGQLGSFRHEVHA